MTLIAAAIFALLFAALGFVGGGLGDHGWELLTSVIGGVIGALAGGVPAYLLSVKAAQEVTSRDKEARDESDFAAMQAVFVKLLEITNGCFTLCLHFNEMLDNAVLRGHGDMSLWQKLIPMVGLEGTPPVQFDSREVGVFMRDAEGSRYVNDLLLLASRYNSLNSSVKDYSQRREHLSSMLPTTLIKDGVGDVKLNAEEAGRVVPLAHALEEIADRLLTTMNDDRRTATRLALEYNERAMAVLPTKKHPFFSLIDQTKV